jgi:hypothetical protein
MKHFPSDFIGIVAGTYSQLYSGTNIQSYALWKVEDGKVVNRISWYDEDQLTLCDEQDRVKAEEMVEAYNFRGREKEHTISEVNGRMVCKCCGQEWSAMCSDDEIPEYCACQGE